MKWRVTGKACSIILLAGVLSNASRADNAAEIYHDKCSACHGKHGKSDTIFGKNLKIRPLASPEVLAQSDTELATIISKGKGRMPSFERKLSSEQIKQVIDYIRSLK